MNRWSVACGRDARAPGAVQGVPLEAFANGIHGVILNSVLRIIAKRRQKCAALKQTRHLLDIRETSGMCCVESIVAGNQEEQNERKLKEIEEYTRPGVLSEGYKRFQGEERKVRLITLTRHHDTLLKAEKRNGVIRPNLLGMGTQ